MIVVIIFGISLVISIIVCIFVKNLFIQYLTSILAGAVHLAFSALLFINFIEIDLTFLSSDSLSKLFLIVLSVVYFSVAIVSYSFLQKQISKETNKSQKYYFLLLNCYLLATTFVILSANFGMYWIATEATTLCVAPLIYYYRDEESLEAMWKYLFMVSIGIAFAFIGILFFTLSANGTILEGNQLVFALFKENASVLNPIWLKAGFIFIFVGLSVKAGLAPLHSADVDATSASPNPIAALMAGSLRITALMGILRAFQIVSGTSIYKFAQIVLISGGTLSVCVAFIFMFRVKNYNRMLAYSSIEHIGLITAAVGLGGLAFIGAMYHVVYNAINKVVLFISAGNIHARYKTREISKIGSVLTMLPWTGWIFLFAFFSISAIPPFGVFFSELMIFEGAFLSDKPIILFFIMFFMLFIFINMGRLIFQTLYSDNLPPDISRDKEKFDIIHIVSLILLVLLITIALINPGILRETIINISKDFGIKI